MYVKCDQRSIKSKPNLTFFVYTFLLNHFFFSYSWVCVYPCYIDVDKSAQEGRKIAKQKGIKDPHAYHMALAVQRLGLSVVYEVS